MNAMYRPAAVLGAVLAMGAAAEPAAPAQENRPDRQAAQALTAEALVEWVIEANPGLAAAETAAEAAAYRIEPAGSLEDPMLSYGMAPLTAGGDPGLRQLIEVSQRIPWPGTLAARESAATYEAAAAARDADAMRLAVTAAAKGAWAEWRFINSALEINRETASLLRDLLATAERRYAAGQARRQDVLQVEVERAALQNERIDIERQRAAVQAGINALLNRAPEAPLPAAVPMSLKPPPPSLEKLLTTAFAGNPELSRRDAELSASESRVTLAEKAFFPNFQVGVGYNAMWEMTEHRPMIGVSINVPFDRSKRRADLDRARAEARSAQLELSQFRAELSSELAAAHADVVQTRQSVILYQEQLVPLASQYLDAALADYRSGAGAFLNVITAEQRKLETDLALARTLTEYAKHVAELERRVGGALESASMASAGVQR